MAQNQNVFPVNQAPSKSNGGLDQATIDNFNRLRVSVNNQQSYVQNGRLWVGSNPTGGTGIASHAAPTATDGTKALAYCKNGNTVASGISTYLQSLQFAITAAGTNATSSRIYLEKTQAGTERFSSGGSTNFGATTLVANNLGAAAAATSMVLRLGAVVTVATSSTTDKLVGEALIRSIIPKVNDQIVIDFGDATGQAGATLLDYANTGAVLTRLRMPMIELAPGEQLLVHLVNAAQDAASSYTMKATWIE